MKAKSNRSPARWLITAGVVLIAVAASLGGLGAWREARDKARFVEALEVSATTDGSSKVGTPRAAMDALGILRMDRLGWSVIVRPTAGNADLARGAGWIAGTALPGAVGNAGIAGHRDTFFRALRHFKINDELTLVTEKGTVRYVVREMKVVDPDRVSVIGPDRRTSLTLVTCYPFYLVGNAPRRFIVKAYQETALSGIRRPGTSDQ